MAVITTWNKGRCGVLVVFGRFGSRGVHAGVEAPRTRPVEGVHASTTELLALLIGSGTRGEQAEDAGERLLEGFEGDLHALARSSVARLEGVPGIGPARAVRIAAAMELGRRRMGRSERHCCASPARKTL